AADRAGWADTRAHRAGDAYVEERGEAARERLAPDVGQRREALDGDATAGGEGEEPDDHDGPADDRQRPRAHGDLGDETERLLGVLGERPGRGHEGSPEEQCVVTEVVELTDDGVPRALEPREPGGLDDGHLNPPGSSRPLR